MHGKEQSGLDLLIPGEIKNDALSTVLYNLAKKKKVFTILEIGSSAGEGSTESLVKGIMENTNQPKLFCIEVSKARCAALKERYRYCSQIYCYNVSSVPVESFPSKQEIESFLKENNSVLNQYPVNTVLDWLQQDIDYLKASELPQNGIQLIKQENNITVFDVVLIDGSEFTGLADLNEVYGAEYIVLDDILAFKNWYSFKRLRQDPNYRLICSQPKLRHGFAAFQKMKK